jgi:hypothetical protein
MENIGKPGRIIKLVPVNSSGRATVATTAGGGS